MQVAVGIRLDNHGITGTTGLTRIIAVVVVLSVTTAMFASPLKRIKLIPIRRRKLTLLLIRLSTLVLVIIENLDQTVTRNIKTITLTSLDIIGIRKNLNRMIIPTISRIPERIRLTIN